MTRSETGAWPASPRRPEDPASNEPNRRWIASCPGSPFSSPTRRTYGRCGAPVTAIATAPQSVAWSTNACARSSSGTLSAGASGAPLISAMPSLAPSEYGMTPSAARARPAGTSCPSTRTKPSPTNVENRWASGTISPAAPLTPPGTTGNHRSFRRSTKNMHSSGLTPAYPLRKPVSRSSIAPRTTGSDSGRPTAVARPARIER